MTLEERYKAAGTDTYVGRVKSLQAGGEEGAGVNFLDGDERGVWGPDSKAAPDQVQKEFTKNAAGDFRYGGGGKVPGSADNTYSLSRWLKKGITKGDTYLTNNRFTTLDDVRNSGTKLNQYGFAKSSKKFIGSLPSISKKRVEGGAAGPSPAGLNG